MTVFLVVVLLSFSGNEQVLPLPLETPVFDYTTSVTEDLSTRLELVRCESNSITDYESWFNSLSGNWPGATFHNGGINNEIRGDVPPDGISSVLTVPGGDSFHLSQIINSGDFTIALYGDPPNMYNVVLNPRILVLLNTGTFKTENVYDFLTYGCDPSRSREDGDFTFQSLKWAEVEDGILYVSNAHRTYSSASGGSNGYITAIDLESLEVLWRSNPLVSNSENFLLLENVIVTGYGFSNEDDFVYLLDRNSGEVIESVPVPTAPEYFYIDGNTVYVRCYDSDCVFMLND